MSTRDAVIVAADDLSLAQCLALAGAVGERVYAVKVHAAYDAAGPDVVARLKTAGARRVWVDAKLHDIPNTVRLRAKAYGDAGADIVSVHASGGVEAMRAARDGAPGAEIYAITVLTSLSEDETLAIYGKPLDAAVKALARLAKAAGMHGLVCSPKEVAPLRSDPQLADMALIVPGVRSQGKDTHDQKRVLTPSEALSAGARRIVVGRQITSVSNPAAALDELESELPKVWKG
jgi:orotidine-5'-phosphate decarboxylase